ncbi:MAG: hypothetical protein H6744_14120 [Deltaproteobacteria bacterium]|nr:hypothetical protein [Deltaproteobacteria bacterium]MCB9787815.1 hypothetical protein [Deltaproteobacteria bacterium]
MKVDASGQRITQLLLRAAELRRKQVQHQEARARGQVSELAARREAEVRTQAAGRDQLRGSGEAIPAQRLALLDDARLADGARMLHLDRALEDSQGQLDTRRDQLRQAGRRHLRAAHVAAYVETRRRSEAMALEQRRLEEDSAAHRAPKGTP